MSFLRKSSKQTRRTTNNPIAIEAHRTYARMVKKLAGEIHEEAVKLPLYRRVSEELGIKGPALAYLISHDGFALRNMSKDRLAVRYQLTNRRRHRKIFSLFMFTFPSYWAVLRLYDVFSPPREDWMRGDDSYLRR